MFQEIAAEIAMVISESIPKRILKRSIEEILAGILEEIPEKSRDFFLLKKTLEIPTRIADNFRRQS